MRKNEMKHQKNGRSTGLPQREVIVADPTPNSADNRQSDCPEELESIKAFKVFLKKSLPIQRPAPDLLVKIHQRIDEVKLKDN